MVYQVLIPPEATPSTEAIFPNEVSCDRNRKTKIRMLSYCRGNSTDLVPGALEASCSLRQLFIAGSQGATVQGEGALTVHVCSAEQAGQDLGMVLVSH